MGMTAFVADGGLDIGVLAYAAVGGLLVIATYLCSALRTEK